MPTQTETGLIVLHLFCKFRGSPQVGNVIEGRTTKAVQKELKRRQLIKNTVDEFSVSDDSQVVFASVLGHKCDFAIMALSPDMSKIRDFQTDIQSAVRIKDSFVSLTEVSEYAQGLPEEMKQARLYPVLPPEDKPVWGFYPMNKKRRGEDLNWYLLPYEKRVELMHEHGASGRKFAGRVVQLITSSTGLDDYEWGVTLFCEKPEDLKDVVYTMRFDEASALYAEFGPFWFGIVEPMEDVFARFNVPSGGLISDPKDTDPDGPY